MALCFNFTVSQHSFTYYWIKNRIQINVFVWTLLYFFYTINTVLFMVTSFFDFNSYLQLHKDLVLILSPENIVVRWTLVALEIKWKVTECSFCPKKAALDMECHRQLFLPHQRTCYKDSPTWVEIMPPIPAPKHTLSCSIVQRGRIGKNVETVQCVLLSKGMQNTGTATFFAWCTCVLVLLSCLDKQ